MNATNDRALAPAPIRDFLTYMETILGKSKKTVDEYFLDLRNFFRYIKQKRNLTDAETDFQKITIEDVSFSLIASITQSDIYDYMLYMSRDRPTQQNSPMTSYGISASTRARKLSAIKAFYRYLTEKTHQLEYNPTIGLDTPKKRKSLPVHLSVDQSLQLLDAVQGTNKERDYCILILFLNCGLRVAEVCALNLNSIQENRLRVLGKGNKERIVYLNDACIRAINAYLPVRIKPLDSHAGALFISRERKRINTQTVKWLVKKYIAAAAIPGEHLSAHKLRHTAATLMYQNGVDVRTLKEVLGHESLDTTMIYTHIENENLQKAADASPFAHVKPPKTTE